MRALVTGGTSGLGAAVAARLLAVGGRVVVTGRDADHGRRTAAELGATYLPADVSAPGQVEAAAAAAVERLGGLDAAVLAAGVNHDAPLSATGDVAWDAVMETNVVGLVRSALAVLPALEATGGALVVVGSDAGLWPEAAAGAYSVSKRCALAVARVLAVEAALRGVRVNAVCPGDIVPGMRSGVDPSVPRVADTEAWPLPPLGRLGRAEDVAEAVAFLLSPTAAFCAGTELLLDGGMSATLGAGWARGNGRTVTSAVLGEVGRGGSGALVTGGTSGIGRAIVARLRAEGRAVLFTGRDEARGRAVELETGARFLRSDARDRRASDAAVDAAAAHSPDGLGLAVANAGVIFEGGLLETPEAAFRELLEVDLTAVFRTARAALPHLAAAGGGSVVVIGSDVGIRPDERLAAYSVAKAGAGTVAELLAGEGAPLGIRANVVCPGDTEPGMRSGVGSDRAHAEDPTTWDPPPSGRFGTGEDVAAVVAALASPALAHVSGATVRVDGAFGAVARAGRDVPVPSFGRRG